MENSASDKKFITMATHSTTKEIVVLQYDLQLHLVTCSQSGTINSQKLCILEINEDKEIFFETYPSNVFVVKVFVISNN